MVDSEHIYLTKETVKDRWSNVTAAVKRWLDVGVRVTVEPKTETRRAVQNRLLHRWTHELAQHNGLTEQDQLGALKHDLLLPLKLSSEKEHERAIREQSMINGAVGMLLALDNDISARELRLEAGYDVIRSRDISVGLFSAWLADIQRYAAESGCVLTCRQDEINNAIARQRSA